MIRFLIFCQLFTSLYGQKIFEEFEKDRNNKYHYKETYRFDSVTDDGTYTLSIENVEGDILVKGHHGSGMVLNITQKIKAVTEKRAKKYIKENKIQVFHSEEDNLVQAGFKKKVHYRRGVSTEFELEVPSNIQLNLETAGGDIEAMHIRGESILKTSGGDIELKSLSGRIDAQTAGGDMALENIEGLIRVHTSGGDIEINHSDGQFNASTSGGDLDFTNLTGNVEAQSSGGSILLENIQGNTIQARTAGGDIEVEDVTANIQGATSGGEISLENVKGNVDVTTSGGDIELDEITGDLICHTSGGEIEGDNIIGTIDATTFSGDIDLRLGYDSHISNYGFNVQTNTGDIYVQLPSAFPVYVDAEVFGSSSTHDLTSDIPLNISTKDNRVVGSGSLNDGTIPMKLRASFGTITIELE